MAAQVGSELGDHGMRVAVAGCGTSLYVARAVAALRDRGIDVHGLLVGGPGHQPDPECERTIARLAEDRRLTDRVVRTGRVDDAKPYIGAMDVLVSASDPEPFGLTLVEAPSSAPWRVVQAAIDAGAIPLAARVGVRRS